MVRVSIRVRDGFGFEFSGFSDSIILNYFLCATLQLMRKQPGTPKIHVSPQMRGACCLATLHRQNSVLCEFL